MRFLIDAQLPCRLAIELNAHGHDAIHTLDLPARNATPDSEIIEVADENHRIVVSKDGDFRDAHLLFGRPRRLLRIATGNLGNAELLNLVMAHLGNIESLFATASYLELSRDELVSL